MSIPVHASDTAPTAPKRHGKQRIVSRDVSIITLTIQKKIAPNAVNTVAKYMPADLEKSARFVVVR